MELALPPHLASLERPMTVDEYMQLPEGPPYPELIDGELVMNPPPNLDHQRVVTNLLFALFAASPDRLEVLPGPVGWQIRRHTVYEPDLVVIERAPTNRRLIEHTPLLCVEVLSPSNRRHDLVKKRADYEAAGLPSYWIIDPAAAGGPSLLALDLVDGSYREARFPAVGRECFEATRPFPVTIDPARLLD